MPTLRLSELDAPPKDERRVRLSDLDIPAEESFFEKVLTGPKEFIKALPEAGLETFEKFGGQPLPLEEQSTLGKIGLGAVGLGRGLAEFPFRVAQAAGQTLPKSLGGPEIPTSKPLREVTGISEFEKFIQEPSVEQGSRAGTVAALYGLPFAARALRARPQPAPKPKMETVARSLEDLAKPEVREKLPIVEKPAEPVAPQPRIAERREAEIPELKVERRARERRLGGIPIAKLEKAGAEVPVPPSGEPLINPKTFAELSPEQRGRLIEGAETVRPEVEKIKGGPVTHEEVLDKAAQVKALDEVLGREQTVELEARTEKLRQEVVRMTKRGDNGPEFQDAVQKWIDAGTASARVQEARKMSYDVTAGGKVKKRTATPEWVRIKVAVTKRLKELGKTAEEIQAELDKVDFKNPQSVLEFNRRNAGTLEKFVNDLTDYRYINMLSGPQTFLERNLYGNLFNALFTRGGQMLGEAIAEAPKALAGKPRNVLFSEIPAYYRGLAQGLPLAKKAFKETLAGKRTMGGEKFDVGQKMAAAPILKPFKKLTFGVMEAQDVAVFELIKRGETLAQAVKAKKQSGKFTRAEAEKAISEASNLAEELLYRNKVDPSFESGQGLMSRGVDAVHKIALNIANQPVIGKASRWVQPFINITFKVPKLGFKVTPGLGAADIVRGISPKGKLTLAESPARTRVLANQLIGSGIATWAAFKALDGKMTWTAPRDPELKKAFYKEGKKEFSVNIGGHWIPLIYFGPLAFPMVLSDAANHYFNENPDRFDQSTLQKLTNTMGGWLTYASRQGFNLAVPDFIESLREGIKSGTVANLLNQLKPLAGMNRWFSQLIDREYRKAGTALTFENLLDQMQKDLPGLSFNVPPADVTGPQRPLPFLPYPITEEISSAKPLFEYRKLELEQNAKTRRLMREAGIQP